MTTSIVRERALALVTTLTVATSMISAPTHAGTIESKWKSNAAGVCQGALPAFAGTLRARPLAVQNEGGASAFITCSFPYNDEESEVPHEAGMGVNLVNNTPGAINTSCTLVSGDGVFAAPVYLVKQLSVAGNSRQTMFFFPSELPGSPGVIAAPNVSCELAPGAGVGYVYYYYARQIGN